MCVWRRGEEARVFRVKTTRVARLSAAWPLSVGVGAGGTRKEKASSLFHTSKWRIKKEKTQRHTHRWEPSREGGFVC
jgi:hypothetical protein